MIKKKILVVLSILLLTTAFLTCEQEPKIGKIGDNIMDLQPMRKQFASKFLIGNIIANPNTETSSGANPQITNQRLLRHYNIITAENHMKPSYLLSSINGTTINYNTNGINIAKRIVDASVNSGVKVVGHTLLWHSQNPNILTLPSNKTNAITVMKNYITGIVGHVAFKGRIHTWDVLNEAFPDGVSATADWKTAMRSNNPWFATIGSDFVYEGFLAARKADPNAILYYNDYNTDQTGKATMIRNMVQEVNNKYLTGNDKPAGEDPNRLLIEGIGMQEHHNTSVSVTNVRNTINMFKNMTFTGSDRKIRLSVSELDILAQTWGQYSSSTPITSEGRSAQEKLYGDLFELYIQNSDIIERVTFWGITDNQSWRARGEPLLFDKDGKAKQAYLRVVGAL